MLAFKTVINIGVSCGILPTKGLPLPFISYGGSSLIFDMVAVGLIMNVSRTGESL
ncbi:MAG: FtsW/RodA/SpoVE family cell cycle protein [Candidatus Omnitrophica bacterium]|nr:FtsW/RodA/SpoVE family cell cycle protein [Candidatus Omnitrophota bacterium]